MTIDQPVGTGFSIAGHLGIPTDEMEMATDLYAALQAIFVKHRLQDHPLFITGESYGGKYVPSIGHFILQMQQQQGNPAQPSLPQMRQIPDRALQLGPPQFKLAGLAVGNGLTDPKKQVLTYADTAYALGLIDNKQRLHALQWQLQVEQLIQAENWDEAYKQRWALLGYIQQCSGIGTPLYPRRSGDYDANKTVDQFLNRRDVKVELGASASITFEGCSEKVGQAMGPDVMKSVKYLMPDLLRAMPVLLYQGQYDLQDGPASCEAWMRTLEWPGQKAFWDAKRHIWWGSKAPPTSQSIASSAESTAGTESMLQQSSGDSNVTPDHGGGNSVMGSSSLLRSAVGEPAPPVKGQWS
jgi:vitellogenic carboxypeptidase-like protein